MLNITEYLEQLNFAPLEAKLYITLLETGPVTVRQLAEIAGKNRATGYLHVNQLIEKGLVIRVVKGSRKLIAALPPTTSLKHLLEQILQEKAQNMEAMVKDMRKLLPDISKTLAGSYMPMHDIDDAEIKFYKGRNGVRKIYEEALQAKELRSYFNMATMNDTLPENFIVFANALKKNKSIKIFEILEDSLLSREKQASFQIQKENNERYFYKFFPKEIKLSAADTLIYDGKVAIVNVGNQITGVVLQNTDFFNNLKELFDFNWKMLPNI